MKLIALFTFFVSVFSWGSVIPLDADVVRPRNCGQEQRNDRGFLLPLAVFNPIEMQCTNCVLEFTYDVPASGGFPKNVEAKFSGITFSNAQKLTTIFSNEWAFPYCLESGKESGFHRETWRFVGPA